MKADPSKFQILLKKSVSTQSAHGQSKSKVWNHEISLRGQYSSSLISGQPTVLFIITNIKPLNFVELKTINVIYKIHLFKRGLRNTHLILMDFLSDA
jgi:hypothetical protein